MATTQQPQQPQTFTTMQQQGVARPPSPSINYAAVAANPQQYAAQRAAAPPGSWLSMQPAATPNPGAVGGGGSPYNPPGATQPTPNQHPATTGPGGSPYNPQGQPNPYHPDGGYPRPPAAPPPAQGAPAPSGPGGYQGGTQAPSGAQQWTPQPYPTQGGYPGMPDLQSMWMKLAQGGGQNLPGQANFQPGGYQGPGQLNAYQRSDFQIPASESHFQGPQVQQQGNFQSPQGGQQVDQRTQQAIMQALGNPSRYGAPEVGAAFDVLNHRLTQQGNADKQNIDADMASRGIYASTTAGGKLGDLATNLNQQRADFATNLGTDQARNFQSDRASAIGQAMGFGGQQFGQGLQGFEANQAAGQQRYGQELGAGQFGLQQNAQNFGQNLGAAQFGLGQNNQNFGQQAQQYGANQQEGLNRFNSGLDQAQFGLAQQGQNWNQQFNAGQQNFNQRQQGLEGLQGYGQQSFNNQLATAGFNADQDARNNDFMLRSLGML